MPTNGGKPEGGAPRARRGRKTTLAPHEPESMPRSAPVSSKEIAHGKRTVLFNAIRQSDITTFLRQFIMLIESGTPILKALNKLAERNDSGESSALRAMIAEIANDVEAGSPLWQAFERHRRQFDEVFVNLIKASEASGTLVTVLHRVVAYRERHELLRKRIRGGMLYPVILLFACFAVVLFISKFVMPEFRDMFVKFGQKDLPFLTRAFMGSTDFVGTWWWVFVLALLVVIALYKAWWVGDPKRRLAADRFKLRMPVLGNVLRKSAVVEMTQMLALLLKSGLSMMETLLLVRDAIHNRAIAQVVQEVRDSVERGEGIEGPLRKAHKIVPAVVTDMMVTGEESGRLDNISEQIAEIYEEEVDIAIGTMGEALQPILTVLIGFLVVMLMLAVFIPLIGMLDTLGSAGV